VRRADVTVAFTRALGKLTRMKYSAPWHALRARLASGLAIAVLVLVLGRGGSPALELKGELNLLTAGWVFDFATWEIDALVSKLGYGLLAPHRFMDDERQGRFVLDYLDDVAEARRLSDEIDRIYTDPEIADPAAVSAPEQRTFADLRASMARRAPIAEAILQSQVTSVLAGGGVDLAASVLPPVLGTFTPLPYVLVVSPRERIESTYQQQLVAGLTAAEQDALEDTVTSARPDISAYITGIGGLAAYPAMLLETSSIDWVTDVYAHEWVHHYLMFFPLGWNYMRNGETRTVNETTASLIGDWAGQEIMLRYYDPLLTRDKSLPDALVAEAPAEGEPDRPFNFRAEMHRTRVNVDRMLADGEVERAEWYMEAQRRYFVAQGYRIRTLNQAYFAFHGAYAASPGGAAGQDPIGPLVRRHWAVSSDAGVFLRHIAPVVTFEDLRVLVS